MNDKSDYDLVDKVFGDVCDKVDEVGFENLSKPEQYIWAIYLLTEEVRNGGFHQYLSNSFSDDALVALEGLQEVGATEVANVCKELFALLPGGKPAPTQEERQDQLDAVDDAMGEDAFDERRWQLEERFYGLLDDLHERMVAFVRAKVLS